MKVKEVNLYGNPLRPVHIGSLCRASDKKAIFQNCHKLKNFHQKLSVCDHLPEADRRLRKLILKRKAEHNTCNPGNRQHLHPHSSTWMNDETCKQVDKSGRADPQVNSRHNKMQPSSQDGDWRCNQSSDSLSLQQMSKLGTFLFQRKIQNPSKIIK